MIMQLKNWILFLCAIRDLELQLKSPAVKRKAPLTDEDKEVASPAKRAKTAIDNNPEIQEQKKRANNEAEKLRLMTKAAKKKNKRNTTIEKINTGVELQSKLLRAVSSTGIGEANLDPVIDIMNSTKKNKATATAKAVTTSRSVRQCK